MTPSQYEQRCAEMLRTNAHNMTHHEIERFAWGAGDRALQRLAGGPPILDDDPEDLRYAIRSAIDTLENAL